MRGHLILCTIVSCLFLTAAYGSNGKVGLKNHEPVLLGYTFDSDDEAFLDFKISLMYPIADRKIKKHIIDSGWYPGFLKKWCSNTIVDSCYPYFSFTGRFGQYIETRDSSPVIAKRFNPKLFLRFDLVDGEYVDLEYAHESNGQRITTKTSYDNIAADLEKTEHANDYISRGWDYLGFTYKHATEIGNTGTVKSTYLSMKEFIGGQLQGDIEEYYLIDGVDGFEAVREITRREQVGGLRIMRKYENKDIDLFWGINKFTFIYETGTRSPAKYNTFQGEMTTGALGVPIMLWVRSGYNSDLAQYYKKIDSFGAAFELATFR